MKKETLKQRLTREFNEMNVFKVSAIVFIFQIGMMLVVLKLLANVYNNI